MLRRRGVRSQLSRFHRLEQVFARRSPRIESGPADAQAAVALVCVPDPDAVLLIRRSTREGDPWSGQMGLPGGRWSPDDPDLARTAIRETAEEVGVQLTSADLVGTLDDLLPRTVQLPRILVRPFVFRLPARVGLHPSHEVAASAWIELDRLLQPGVYQEWDVEAGGRQLRYPGYRLPEGVVWGLTERILTPFLATLGETALSEFRQTP